jgi:hypothetical protein
VRTLVIGISLHSLKCRKENGIGGKIREKQKKTLEKKKKTTQKI